MSPPIPIITPNNGHQHGSLAHQIDSQKWVRQSETCEKARTGKPGIFLEGRLVEVILWTLKKVRLRPKDKIEHVRPKNHLILICSQESIKAIS